MNSNKKTDLRGYESEFDEKKLLTKLKRFAKKAGIECVYYVLLLWHAMKSPNTSLADKAIIAGALGYFILPIDLIPDIMIGTGYIDDVGMLTMALTKIASDITPKVKKDTLYQLHKYFDFIDSDFRPKMFKP